MSSAPYTYDLSLLDKSREKWLSSSGIRLVYKDIFEHLLSELKGHHILEVGSGIGNGKDFIPHLVTSDIVKTKYVDQAVSCYELEEVIPSNEEALWDAIIGVDVLHHLEFPIQFFKSASKALKRGGRIVLCEPAATRWGRAFYNRFHHEPCNLESIQSPYCFSADKDDEFSNMAMSVALFERDKVHLTPEFQAIALKLRRLSYAYVISYPLSGGYSRGQYAPSWFIQCMIRLERMLPQSWLKHIALRNFITLEKI
ncbi:MAG TPA: hypothetical protein DIU37_04690 [Opitutae bacterium]|nr:hypothetical protein [Opitutae bacterium]|tara:strand:+ start:6778 stop:7542 length:765 start_codon:yes stop_codon:yes gene_type:complete